MKKNFEASDKWLKCFIEQHGITLKINKGKTNTINSPQDPSCSLVVEAVEPECEEIKIEEHPVLPNILDPGQPEVDEARQHDDLPSQGTIESQSGNQLPTNKHCGRDVHCEWLNDMTQKFSEKLSDYLWEPGGICGKIHPAGGVWVT